VGHLVPAGLGDLGGRPLQGRADVVHVDLVDGALVAFGGLVLALLEAAGDEDAGALVQGFGGVSAQLAPG